MSQSNDYNKFILLFKSHLKFRLMTIYKGKIDVESIST